MPVSTVLCVRAHHLILLSLSLLWLRGHINIHNIIHHLPYFSSVCSLSESIRAAGSYLRGHAINWFDPNCDKSSGAVTWGTYREFLDAFKAAYDDPDRRATTELMQLC